MPDWAVTKVYFAIDLAINKVVDLVTRWCEILIEIIPHLKADLAYIVNHRCLFRILLFISAPSKWTSQDIFLAYKPRLYTNYRYKSDGCPI